MKSICFCGVDGCGKSTQAEILFNKLKSYNREAIYTHVLSKRKTALSKLQDTSIIGKLIEKIRSLEDKNIGRFIKITLRLLNVVIDSWITTTMNAIAYRNKIIIYDRYFYDVLVILTFSYQNLSDFILQFAKLIPKPDIVILYDISPEVLFERKAGHTLVDLQSYCKLYKQLEQKIVVSFIITEELAKEEVARKIEQLYSKTI